MTHPVSPRKNVLGPGLITGAADDDPSGIATYSQAGAQFGFSLCWTMLLTLPFMAAIQIICGTIGHRTRRGLAHAMSRVIALPLLRALVALVVVANTLNIAADLAAMGEALKLVVGGPAPLFALLFGLGCVIAEVLIPYHRYARYLKFLTLLLLFYVGAAFSVSVPWGEVARATLLPDLHLDRDRILVIVAVFGTTISPYLFFWQASQEAEEARLARRRSTVDPHDGTRRIAFDTWIGMALSNAVAFFIIVTAGATLHASGITQIDTAAQAAEALRPIAGELAFALFAAGIIATGLLAVPVLAGSAAYAVADTVGIRGSLELPAHRARGFYAIIGAATLIGAALGALDIDPIAMLFWTAVINGIVSVPLMIATMVVASSRTLGATLGLSQWIRALGWIATALMAASVALLAWFSIA